MRRVADLLSPSKRAATPPTKKGRLRTLANDVRIVCPGSLDEGGRSRDAQSFRADLQRILRAGPPGRSAAFARTGRRSGSRNPLAVEHDALFSTWGRVLVPSAAHRAHTVGNHGVRRHPRSSPEPPLVVEVGASLQRFTVHEVQKGRNGTLPCSAVITCPLLARLQGKNLPSLISIFIIAGPARSVIWIT